MRADGLRGRPRVQGLRRPGQGAQARPFNSQEDAAAHAEDTGVRHLPGRCGRDEARIVHGRGPGASSTREPASGNRGRELGRWRRHDCPEARHRGALRSHLSRLHADRGSIYERRGGFRDGAGAEGAAAQALLPQAELAQPSQRLRPDARRVARAHGRHGRCRGRPVQVRRDLVREARTRTRAPCRDARACDECRASSSACARSRQEGGRFDAPADPRWSRAPRHGQVGS